MSSLKKLVPFFIKCRNFGRFSPIWLQMLWFCYRCVRKYQLTRGYWSRIFHWTSRKFFRAHFLKKVFWKNGVFFRPQKNFKSGFFDSFKNDFLDPKSKPSYLREFLRFFDARKCVGKLRHHIFWKNIFMVPRNIHWHRIF